MRLILIKLLTTLFWLAPALAIGQELTMEKTWPVTMTQYLSTPGEDGLMTFDYAALIDAPDDRGLLGDYITDLEKQDPDNMSQDEAVSFWANLYNALTVRVVSENYPVDSIREIKSGLFSSGPWGKKITEINGERLSLDNIEHDILRKQYPSPFIHYMLNCASVGCPNLKAGEWRTETLEHDQIEAARNFINSPRGALVTSKGLKVSSIYKWFKEDFGGSRQAVVEHLSHYADDDLAVAIKSGAKIKDYDYDWSLNGADHE